MKSHRLIVLGSVRIALLICVVGWQGLFAQNDPSSPAWTVVRATGTGRTTGHIADLTLRNDSDAPVTTLAQAFYIPSDGKYQPYVGRIPEGVTVPSGSVMTIPLSGYCADVHTPPCPAGVDLPPVTSWLPVGPATWLGEAIPANELFLPTPPVQDPQDILILSPEREELTIRLRPRRPIVILTAPPTPRFEPVYIPAILNASGYEPQPEALPIVITWPDTDMPVGGTLDPGEDPRTFAGVVVEAIDRIEETFDRMHDQGDFQTPFSGNPEKEREAVIQQTFWIYVSALTGEAYTKQDFTGKVHQQYSEAAGKPVTAITAEEKEQLEPGVTQFWDVFAATGVEAKVISVTSPGLDVSPDVLASVSTPACQCDKISYRLKVTKGGLPVHSETHDSDTKNVKVFINGLAFGDELAVEIADIRADCACGGSACLFYPAESTNSGSPGYTTPDMTRQGKADIEMSNDDDATSENSNCTNEGKSWSAEGTVYSFRLKTKDEGTTHRGIFQKIRIKTYCALENCRTRLCAKYINLHFAASANE